MGALIVLGILVFMFLVLIHELGHFISAKRSGVKVLEFGIGIPPKVCKLRTDKSGTEYTLNLLLLGGFVRLKGEDPKDTEDFNAKDSFIKAKLRKKVIILIAGVTSNILFAWLAFSAIFFMGTRPISVLPANATANHPNSYLMPTIDFLEKEGLISGKVEKTIAKVDSVLAGLIADNLGIISGDIIDTINSTKVDTWNINKTLQENIGKQISIVVKRGDQTFNTGTKCPDDECILGITLYSTGKIDVKPIKFGFQKALVAGAMELNAETRITLTTLGNLGKNLISFDRSKIKNSVNKLSGPAGAIKFGEVIWEDGGKKLYLGFAGMISLALAIFNVLPIPALDGGRLLGVLIQGIFRLKPEKYFTIESYINFVFFVLLMGLGIYILLKDLVRFRNLNIPFIG